MTALTSEAIGPAALENLSGNKIQRCRKTIFKLKKEWGKTPAEKDKITWEIITLFRFKNASLQITKFLSLNIQVLILAGRSRGLTFLTHVKVCGDWAGMKWVVLSAGHVWSRYECVKYRARFFCFRHTVSWDEMSWASFSCSHEHMLTVSSVWVFLFYKSPISPEMGSAWAWDRNHGLFCVPTLPVCSARRIYIIFLNEACARDVGYMTSQSRQ